MPSQREDIPVPENNDGQHLGITAEQLNDIWENCMSVWTDRKEGESTIDEICTAWGLSTRTVQRRLNIMAESDIITRRHGLLNGKHVIWIKLKKGGPL